MKKSLVALAALSASMGAIAQGMATKVHDALFNHMARSGLVLGMAELATVTRTSIDIAAGRKTHPAAQNRERMVIIDTPAVYTAAQNDTFGTGIVLPKGSRLLAGPILSNAANTAALTLALGLRDAVTKVAVDATAIMAATGITAAGTAPIYTGTKLTAGQYYVLPQDCEIYGTFAGAAPTANAAIRAEIGYVSP